MDEYHPTRNISYHAFASLTLIQSLSDELLANRQSLFETGMRRKGLNTVLQDLEEH